MSKIEQLIKKFCPKGVERGPLSRSVAIKRGVRVVKQQLKEEGQYPVFQNCLTSMGFYDQTNCPAGTAFVIAAGAAGAVGYSDVDFWAADDCYYMVPPESVNGKYLYYALKSKEHQLLAKVRKASVPRLAREVVESIEIAFPPRPVQDEIVKALDAMDAVVKALEEERNARFEQFEAMRDKLLKFANGGGYCKITIAELGDFYAGLAGKTKKDFGVGEGRFLTYMDIFSNFAAPARPSGVVDIGIGEKQSMVKKGDVIFTGSSETKDEAGMTCVVEKDYDQPVYLNSFCFGLRVKNVEGVCVEFMKYFFRSTVVRGLIAKTANGVTRFNISKDALRKVQICVPEIEEQRRIAKTLDSLASILIALDEEIAARREQFAGWLEKLMEFKEAA